MFKKSDFKRLQILGEGKKNTKIYKAVHIDSGNIYALKEIEAKNFDKLNQYKEEAVQLMKVQNHPNVIKLYGYYFQQTKYNTFKIGIVTEIMDGSMNLQYIYRKRQKKGLYWEQSQLTIMLCSIISTCAFLETRGISHRDIKPANIFLLPNNQLKLIDFGQSTDFVYNPNSEHREGYVMFTVRGTPQYLSPALWKAHVIDASRYVEHNVYKSDVFSVGLVLMQLALMDEVTGFNAKTIQVNGEKLIKESVKVLSEVYSSNIAKILELLLIFDEFKRPSFCQIEKIFMEREVECQEKSIACNEIIIFYNQFYNNLFKQFSEKNNKTRTNSLQSTFPLPHAENKINPKDELYQTKKNYYEGSTLILHDSCYWFEFGGSSIGRFSISRQKWKVASGNQQKKFPLHFTVIFIPIINAYYLLGGPPCDNFRIFQTNKKLIYSKYQMPTNRNFFPAVYYSQKVYVFGGYNGQTQIKSCQFYDIVNSKWNDVGDLKIARSQSGACRINDEEIIVCGGYSKQNGTLNSIQRFVIKKNKFQLTNLKLPIPLRRFMIIRVAKNEALVLGGLTTSCQESQRVFKLMYSQGKFIELESLEKGGIIENEVLIDKEGNIHLFLEHANGTSPYSHIKYRYDPKSEEYETKQVDY